MVSKEVNAKAKDSAKKAQQYPMSTQFAIMQVLPNILNGAFWGFTDAEAIQKYIKELRQDSNIVCRKLGNACLVEVDKEYLCKVVLAIDPDILGVNDIQIMKEAMQDAHMECEGFLARQAKSEKGFEGTIGVYCVNDVATINYKGVNYHAFRLPMTEILTLLNMYGYKVKVGSVYVTPQEAANAGQAFWDSTQLSPTRTGVFMQIKSTLTPEQGKELHKQFKARFGK